MNQELNELVKSILGPALGGHTTARKVVMTLSFDEPRFARTALHLKPALIDSLSEYLPMPIDDIHIEIRRES